MGQPNTSRWVVGAQWGLVLVALASIAANVFLSLRAEQRSSTEPHIRATPPGLELSDDSESLTVRVTLQNLGEATAHGCRTVFQEVNRDGLPIRYLPSVWQSTWPSLLPGETLPGEEVHRIRFDEFGSDLYWLEVWGECHTDNVVSQSWFVRIEKTATGATVNTVGGVSRDPSGPRPWPLMIADTFDQPCPGESDEVCELPSVSLP